MAGYGEELKQKILDAAWGLFEEKGYKKTTVNDIIRRADTSKGGFYYYFKSKDELLHHLYKVFDTEYEKFYRTMDSQLNSMTRLKQLSQYMLYFIEGNMSPEFMFALYDMQEKQKDNFQDQNRYYFRLVKQIITEGQQRKEIRDDMSAEELEHHVLVLEKGIILDWCVQNGAFSLGYFGTKNFELYIEFMKYENKN